MGFNHIERLGADRAGRSEKRHFFHRTISFYLCNGAAVRRERGP
ncbi:hypothetical protein BN871_EQ_00120 [Paenibacillus sp. P22]|nr:hypothetical protein BN871_EQ_00120 [Paenibacillus sp. P22]